MGTLWTRNLEQGNSPPILMHLDQRILSGRDRRRSGDLTPFSSDQAISVSERSFERTD